MDRRGFFKLFGAGIAGIALKQAIPLGRVWSFPSNIVVPKLEGLIGDCVGFDWAEERDLTAVTVTEFYREISPQRYVLYKMIDQRFYEVAVYPGAIPFKVIDAHFTTAP